MLKISYYTDPLCCWSWAMEQGWTELLEKWGHRLEISYKMAGITLDGNHFPGWLYTDWTIYEHPAPKEMPRSDTGYPIWLKDAPSSSIPACLAVKCVQLQSPKLAVLFLRLLREAVMLRHLNISRLPILLELAADLSHVYPFFNLCQFRTDLFSRRSITAFQQDVDDAAFYAIDCLPTIILTASQASSIKLCGFASFQTLDAAVSQLLSTANMDY